MKLYENLTKIHNLHHLIRHVRNHLWGEEKALLLLGAEQVIPAPVQGSDGDPAFSAPSQAEASGRRQAAGCCSQFTWGPGAQETTPYRGTAAAASRPRCSQTQPPGDTHPYRLCHTFPLWPPQA